MIAGLEYNLGEDPHWENNLERSGHRWNTVKQYKEILGSEYYMKFWGQPKITMDIQVEVSNCVTDLYNVVAGELSDESGTLPVLGMAQAQLTSLIS